MKQKLIQKQDSSQKVAVHALQKQLQVLQLKEYLVIASFILGGALLRVPMQSIPSAEPLTFFALLSGWLFGRKKGFITGVGALYLSNFFMFGGHGIWTLFQAIGFGLAGFMGGFLRKKASILETVLIASIATLLFEITINIGSLFMFPTNIFILFFTALPFTITHFVSNIGFALFLPKAKELIEKKGGFDEKELCTKLTNNLRAKFGNSRLPKPANQP